MTSTNVDTLALRPPEELMRIERIGALQPNELSFSRSLLRRMINERWQIESTVFEIDERARGDAIYRIDTGSSIFHFIVFSLEPKLDGERTNRIIGRNWDMFGSLIEGEATPEIVETTRQELPKLYAGRAPEGTLIWCRSNRSSRVFDHVLERLSEGRQPDISTVAEIGYIMRNTGLDGNGTFGTKSYLAYEPDHELRTPYHAQMLCAFMMREFAADLIEHLARCKSSKAVRLSPEIKRFVGVGNGSALGLGLWIMNHPHWVNRWLTLREQALANAKAQRVAPEDPQVDKLLSLLDRCIVYRSQDRTDYGEVFTPSKTIANELTSIRPLVQEFKDKGTIKGEPASQPWATLCNAMPTDLAFETQESIHALLIDLYPEFADEVEHLHRIPEVFELDPMMPVSELLNTLHTEYAWAFDIDLSAPGAYYYTWYKSEEREEPRRGPRHEVDEGYELGLDVAGEVQELDRLLNERDPKETIGEFLLQHPERHFMIERIQSLHGMPYHTPHINMFDEDFIPAYLTRLVNVPFFGLDKTRARMRRALTGLIHHGAPTAADIAAGWEGEWRYPAEPELEEAE